MYFNSSDHIPELHPNPSHGDVTFWKRVLYQQKQIIFQKNTKRIEIFIWLLVTVGTNCSISLQNGAAVTSVKR